VLRVEIQSVPWVASPNRMTIEEVAPNFWRAEARFGFMERPHIPELLTASKTLGCTIVLSDVTYYVGHETVVGREEGMGLPAWQGRFFAVLTGHAPRRATARVSCHPRASQSKKGRIRSRLGQQHFDFHRKLCIGDVNAVCMEWPFLHAFAFTETDHGQICGLQLVCSIDFHRTPADFSFVSVFAKHDFHEPNYIPCH
jgi:hypothetical protein